MTQFHDEAIAAVSASISAAGDGDLLTAIHASEQKWQAELDEAKMMARTLLATVLSERETLRTSLGTAAELWRTLRPSEERTATTQVDGSSKCDSDPSFLADEEQLAVVKALRNVSHTLFLTEFIISAPEALERAHSALTKIKADGLEKVVPGHPAQLVEAHAILAAGERLRNLVLLEAPKQCSDELSPLQNFSTAKDIRDLLEEIILQGVFSRIIAISQQNPRLLVAAARVIESEQREASWWRTYLVRYDDPSLNDVMRSCGDRMYKERALEAIVKSLQAQFRKKEQELGLTEEASEAEPDSASQGTSSQQVCLKDILDWIRYRRSENETVRRFVVPCLPPSFAVSELFEQELHREFMRVVTLVLHRVAPDGSMLLSESDLIQLTSWYSSYKQEVGDQNEDIDSFLQEEDRERLISALQKHCASRISSKISSTFAADMEMATIPAGPSSLAEKESIAAQRNELSIHHTDLPDIVLGCVNEEVKRILALKIKGLDHAIAQTAAGCLKSFQEDVQQSLMAFSDTEQENYRLHACRVANNMARCLELSEYLRGLFVPVVGDRDHSDIEDKMDSIIEGFRCTSSRALQVLVNGMNADIESLAARFFAPHTGTEIMLDIIATLDDYFHEYEVFLLDYHYEHLAIESLRKIVVWYLAPFIRLSNHELEENVARRFVSLPTYDEMNLHNTRSDVYEEYPFTIRSDNEGREKPRNDGLSGMNSAAVVAQLDKDISNLTVFMEEKVVSFQKKQLQPVLEPLHMIRAMYTCPAAAFSLAETFREASNIIGRVLRPSWVMDCGVDGRFTVRVAEMIWCSRPDVSPVVRLDAINTIRATSERLESTSQSRMSSFDDGRICGSRNSDYGGSASERLFRKDARSSENAGSSSSLLWAPSPSRSSRSRSKRQ